MHLKSILNFFGLWGYPFGLIISGLFSYSNQTMRMREFTLDKENLLRILIGGLAALDLENRFDGMFIIQ